MTTPPVVLGAAYAIAKNKRNAEIDTKYVKGAVKNDKTDNIANQDLHKAESKRNLIAGIAGGSALGAMGGAAYEQYDPQNAPSILTTTAAGAGIGGISALLLNAINKSKSKE